MEHYLECKARLFARQGPDDTAVLNQDDDAVRELGEVLRAKEGGPRVAYFSTSTTGGSSSAEAASSLAPDSWIEDGWMFLRGRPALPLAEVQIPGRHNLENCLAAGTAALARGVPIDLVAQGLRTFTGVEHRLEQAGIIDGVTYVNDSKATNVEATLTALQAYPENTHLILGGRDKASDYRPVARACASACRGVYLIGEATPLIEQGFAEVETSEPGTTVPSRKDCGDLENALRAARAAAKPGDVILLAPACASFDQYRSFEQRGEHFRDIVRALMRETR
jgi:UDP-N-acetylmuramoylalanine--D-glutamate ligase